MRRSAQLRQALIILGCLISMNIFSQQFIEQTGISLTGVGDHSSVAWGDYDKDGDLDILLTGSGYSKIYQNNSNIFAEPPGINLTGVRTSSAAWGDYDNDGDLDILLTGSGSSKIYRNTGNPLYSFEEQTTITLPGISSGSASWADYDNDGDLDILLTGSGFSKIYRNNGDNSFTEQTSISITGVETSSAAWGDYDNDGYLDILLTGYAFNNGISRIFRNNGNNSFSEQTGINLQGINAGSAIWGDYDNDGDLDILQSGWGSSKIYKNNGNSTFTEQTAISLQGLNTSNVTWIDYDNDGDLDILLTGVLPGSTTRYSKIYKNNNNNSFTEQTDITLPGVENGSSAWGDYNKDGKLDLLLTGYTGSENISRIYLNNCPTVNNSPAAPTGLISSISDTLVTLRWNRVTGDATPSKGMSYNVRIGTLPGTSNVVASMASATGLRLLPGMGNTLSDTIYILRKPKKSTYYWSVQAIDNGFASGVFASEKSFNYSTSIQASQVFASNIQVSTLTLNWRRGNGSACAVFACKANSGTAVPVNTTTYTANSQFGSGSQIGSTGWFCVYNGTGSSTSITGLEVLADYIFQVIEFDAGPSYYSMNGQANPSVVQTGAFAELTGSTLLGVNYSSVAWGDYNNDTYPDILLTGAGISKIYLNNGGNSFTENTEIVLPGVTSGTSAAWGDYDNDGYLDFILTGWYNSTAISKIFRNNGNSTFTEQTLITLKGVYSGSVAWGDYDNNGFLDILLTGYSPENGTAVSKIYRNNGNNSFTEQTGIILPGVSNSSVAWGDYDNDSDLDILLTGYSYSASSLISRIYRNNGNGSFSEQTGISMQGVSGSSAAWGDYDNDSDLDILLTGGGYSKIYRNNGNNTFSEQTGIILQGVTYASSAWGDYDNDGNLDILITGSGFAKIYRNNGNNTFTEKPYFSQFGVIYGSAAWGDYNTDGRLDILLTGQSGSNISKIFRNYSPVSNSAPSAPTGLAASGNETSVIIAWNRVTGDATPAKGISYNVRIGTLPGKNNVVSAMSVATGPRLLPAIGNAQMDTLFVLRSPKKTTYYYSVQAIDNGFASGLFAAEKSITYSISVQASQVVADSIKTTAINLRWIRGNGSSCVVFAKKGNSGSAVPVNGTSYNANANFGSGDKILSSEWFCVYKGTGNDVIVTGLEPNTNYAFQAIEFDAGPSYYTQSGQANPLFTQTALFVGQTNITLPGVYQSSAAWGDYDKDGNQDFLLTGNSVSGPFTKIYRNNGNRSFTLQSDITLPGVMNSSSAWGDYDNDGDLDILLTGNSGSSLISKIFRNDSSNVFSEQTGISLTGVQHSSVTWGDYDNDGDLDILLTGHNGSNGISKIYRNNGNNTFTEQTGISLQGVAYGSVAWGDYDNDGDLDILLTGFGYSKIYRNNRDNTFTEQGITITGVNNSSAAWGDYDNDGYIDILITGKNNSSIPLSKVYRNNGNNTFSEQTGIVLPGVSNGSVVWGDFDNDGYSDIILTGTTNSSASGAVTKFFHNNGNNTFTEKPQDWEGVRNGSVAKADYDKDGKLDILLTGESSNGYVLKIYRNFSPIINIAPTAPAGLAATTNENSVIFSWNRVTGDATPAKGISYNIRVGTAPGKGNIVSPMSLASGSRLLPQIGNAQSDSVFIFKFPKKTTYYWSVQAIDNGSAPGVFTTEQTVTYSVSVQASQIIADTIKGSSIKIRWTRGNGSACAVFALKGNTGTASPANGITYVANQKFGDGSQIGTTKWYCVYNGTGNSFTVTGLEALTYYTFHVIEYDPGPAYETKTAQVNPLIAQSGLFDEQTGVILPGVNQSSVLWGDYDNDGDLDILLSGVTGTGPISKIYQNDGNNVFILKPGIALQSTQFGSLAWGDYDNDNDLDLLLTGSGSSKIYRNNGDRTFTDLTTISLTGVAESSSAWGDYDNDGDLDILITGSGYSKIYRNNGNHTFTEQTGISLTGVTQSSAAWGDYDNDGDLDILLTGSSSSGNISKIYRNNCNNTFTEQTGISLTGVSQSSVAWGDYDNDGDLDIILTGYTGSTRVSKIYRNNSDNTFTEQTAIILPGVLYGSLAMRDFDNDGFADIILTGATDGSVTGAISKFYRNNGNNTFTEQTGIIFPGVYQSSIDAGDYNNDGRLDILLTGQSGSGLVSKIYLNTCATPNSPPAVPAGLVSTSTDTTVILRWNRVPGDVTPFKGTGYNVRIGTTAGGTEIVSPMALPSGTRLLPRMGNTQSDTLFLLKYPKKTTYYWSVQAIDNGLTPGVFADEKSFSFSASIQASQVYASNPQGSTLNLNWTRGNGLACVVFAKAGNSGTAVPLNGISYTADPQIGLGSQISTTGWYCVYNGSGSNVSVTGLVPLTDYIFHVIEYESGQLYYTQTGQSNPMVTQTSLFAELDVVPLTPISSGSVAWGDNDMDGDLDILLTGNGYSRIAHNNGNNSFFGLNPALLPGASNSSAAWGDCDNDNDLDILLTGSGYSRLFRNNGNSTYTEQPGAGLSGIQNGSVAWGDYDNDGYADILLTGRASAGISKIYRNNGNSTFTDQTGIVLPGIFNSSVAWGDYDNDGFLDFIITGTTNGIYSGALSKVYRNNGDNSFTEQTGILLQAVFFSSVAWSDYDSDGDLDILLTGQSSVSAAVSKIYRNNGDNTFTDQTGITLPGVSYSSVAWGDYDSDGDPDILLTGRLGISGTEYLSKIFRNNGNNTFTEQTGVNLTGIFNGSVAWGDYNNDGKPDILLSGQAASGTIARIYRNFSTVANSAPSTPAGLSATTDATSLILRWNRVTGDATPARGIGYNVRIGTLSGSNDIVTPIALASGLRLVPRLGNVQADTFLILKYPKKLTYYWSVQAIDNSFSGSPFAGEQINAFSNPIQAYQVLSDEVQGSSINLSWRRGNGSACLVFAMTGSSGTATPVDGISYTAGQKFGTGTQIGSTGWYCVYNGIGNSAIINGLESLTNYIFQVIEFDTGPVYYTQNGIANPAVIQTGMFTEDTRISLPGVQYSSVAWGDYDNDGDLDILLTGNSNTSKIFRNNSDSTFSEQTGISLAGVNNSSAAWGDYDNDGDLDILLTGTTNGSASGAISKIYRNNGNNTFTIRSVISLQGVYYGSSSWGDYDNDGDLDILLTGTTNGSTQGAVSKIYRNMNDSTFTEQTGIALQGVVTGSAAWGDYDNDGYPDILLTGSASSGNISKIYRNNGNNTFTEQTGISLPAVSNSSVAWGDYDNDGDLDILLTGSTSSKLYRNDGNNSFTIQTGINITGVSSGSALWGDYDNDGYLDITISGQTSSISTDFTKFYHNNGNNSFTEQTNLSLPGVYYSSMAWGDYDKDGDLDLLATGINKNNTRISKIYRNLSSKININPPVPTGLSTVVNDTSVVFKWNRIEGDATPSAGIGYNIRVGTSPGANDIVPSMSLSDGLRLLPKMGNIQTGTSFVLRYPEKADYYWSVQSLDHGFASGAFAAEKTFTFSSPLQALQIFADSIKPSSLKLHWQRGNGSACMVVARKGISGTANPVNGTTYLADKQFGAGSNVGSEGWFCIYNGTGTNVNITGLDAATNYTIQVIEYDAGPVYYTQKGEANPIVIQTDLFTEQTSISLQGIGFGSVAWGDYDNDGYLDILSTGSSFSRIYRNNGNNTFTQQTGIILAGVGNSSAAWCDYDNDGYLDILLTGSSISRIYRNNGNNTYTEQTNIILPGVNNGSVAWGDYDNDGYSDILLTGRFSTSADYLSRIYRNNGKGSFTEQTNINLQGVGYSSVAWGDYDNDGYLDILLTGNTSTESVSKIYRNNRNNNFVEQTGISLTEAGYSSAAWCDYDNDGDLDVLLTGNGISKIYRNNGNSSFTEQTDIILQGVSYGSAAWGDYDNDGFSDIILTGTTNGLVSGAISKFYRNNGNNTFTEQTGIQLTGVYNSSIACGDYDNDGKLDLLLTGQNVSNTTISKIYRNFSTLSNNIPVAPNGLISNMNDTSVIFRWNRVQGDNTPSKGLGYNIRLGTSPGSNDMLSPMTRPSGSRLISRLGNTQSDTLFVLRYPKKRTYFWSVQAIDNGFTPGAFAPEQSFTFSASTQASQVFASNIQGTTLNLNWRRGNGDGCIVFAKKGTSGTATPVNGLYYTADPQFSKGSQIGESGWYCVYLGDDNNVTVSGLEGLASYVFHVIEGTEELVYFTQKGQGNPLVTQTSVFTEQTGINISGVSGSSVAWGDYDKDGDLDILLTGNSIARIYRNNNDNTFTAQTGISLTGVNSSSAAWGDYNNDSYLDILLTGQVSTSSGPVSKIYKNNGNNTFTEQTGIVLQGVSNSSVAWGDYDNDGYLDILLTGRSFSNDYISALYRNNGDNTFTEQTGISLIGVQAGSVAWGDYNKDGNLDILLTGATSSNAPVSRIYRNNGNNTFTEQTSINIKGVNSSSVAWGDYDNDGDLDILLNGRSGTTIAEFITRIYRNNGDNTFTDQTSVNLAQLYVGSLAWGDYDNDGDLDILLTGRSGFVSIDSWSKIYRNKGNNNFTEQTNINLTGVYSSSVAWGDYDKDGKLDIFLTGNNPTSGVVSKIYKNCYPAANTVPESPTGLSASSNETSLILRWNRVQGDATPAKGMGYNVRIGYSPGANEVIPTMSLPSGSRLIPRLGNAQADTFLVLKNPKRITYYWSVQAIDHGFASSPFATEQSFQFLTPIQTSQVFADSMQISGINLRWNRGNGNACVVFARKGNGGTATPVNLTAYTANSHFGSGSPIGSTDWYCVYNGTGNKVNITGLERLTYYTFQVIEYDAVPNPLYFTQNGQGNPAVVQTNIFSEQTGINLTGISYGSVAWGDYDNNGFQDLLVSGTTTGSYAGAVSKIYRNNGNNTFTEQYGISLTGVMNSSVAWGDYDNDCDLDILLTGLNTVNEAVSKIFLNNGNNSFTEQASIILTGVKESSVAWSDFDNDGDLDILLTGISSTGEMAKIYRNNGNNTFSEQQGINLSRITNGSVACADYDNDGYTDILLTGLGFSKIYRNNGNPLSIQFTEQTGIGLTGITKSSVAWGDYDSDGDLDILLTGYDITNEVPVSKIYRNNGNNSFTWQNGITLPGMAGTTTTGTPTSGASSALWGDYDNDGDLDILLTGETNSGRICKVFTNNGNNTFKEQANFGFPGVRYSSAAWSDYDYDGDLDLIIMGEMGTIRISKIFLNEMLTHNVRPAAPLGLKKLENADDVILSWNSVTTDETPAKGLTYNIRVGTSSGGSQVKTSMSQSSGEPSITAMGNCHLNTSYILRNLLPGTYYWSVQAVDNGFAGGVFGTESSFKVDSLQASKLEGKLLRSNQNALSLKWKNGNGERRVVFCRQGSTGTAYPVNSTTYTADPIFGEGDQIGATGWFCVYNGRDDSTTVVGLSQGAAYSFQVFEYNGATGSEILYRTTGVANPGIFSCGLFSDQSDLTLPGVYNSSVAWGDYDNDGALDILLTGYTGSTPISKIYRNNRNNSFIEQSGISLFGVQNGSVAYADYDNDGDLDILLTGVASGTFPVSKIYRNNGNNSFTEQLSISLSGVSLSSVAWGDYDNDGDQDILLTGQGAGSTFIARIYKNNGNSTFTEQTGINLTRISKGSASWSDYDNDGDLDIFLTGNSSLGTQSSVLKIYQNNGNNIFLEQSGITITGVMNSSINWGDYDNDDDLDILLTGYYNDGSVRYISRIYKNNGDNTFTEQTGIILDGVANGSVSWGDFDNDGDLDILLTGRLVNGGVISKIYRNNNDNTFTEVSNITLTGVGYSSASWGDYDNDGDLDILLSGQGAGTTAITKIYRNNALMKAGEYAANKKPSAPANLKSTPQPQGMKLTWSVVKSDETPLNTLTYNIIIKAKSTGLIACPAQADTLNGYRQIVEMGNSQLDTSFIVKNLTPGNYYWKVQAIDQGYKGGDWSGWSSFEAKNIRAFFSADTACSGSETNFTNESTSVGEPILTYSWDFGDGKTSDLQNPAYTFASAGIHNVRLAVSSASNSDTLIKQVLVYPTPVSDFSSSIACQGDETILENLTVTSGLNITDWSWDFGDGKGSIQQNPGSHGYLSEGDYLLTLVAVTANGCSDTIRQNVQVGAFPAAAITADAPLTFCKGDSVSLSVSYNKNYSYMWMIDGTSQTGGDSSKYVAKLSGKYSVEVVNSTGNCKTKSSEQIIEALNAPASSLISASGPIQFCQGDSVVLSVTKTDGYSYEWKLNGGIVGTNSNQYSAKGSGRYNIVAINGSGCTASSSNSIDVVVNSAPSIASVNLSGPPQFCQGGSINLSVTPVSGLTYNWRKETGLIAGATNSSYTSTTSGNYQLDITNASGCIVKTTPVNVVVMPMPNKPVITSDNYQTGKCLGETPVKLKVNQEVSGYNYQWSKNGIPLSKANSPFIEGFLAQGDYTLEASLNACKSVSDNFNVTFADALPKPLIYAQGPTIWYLACSNDTAAQYKWYYNGNLISGAVKYIYVANHNLGRYHVSIANSKGCFTISDTLKIPTGVTGIEDVDVFANLNIFPNPTTGLFTIEMDNMIFGDLMIKIINQEGKQVQNIIFEKSTEHFSNQIDLSGQPKGMYLIKLLIDKYNANRKVILE